jgi:hypothetical protein
VFYALIVAGVVSGGSATAEPGVVIDDQLSLGVPISCIMLDSTHFGERMLLVGTDTAADGRSFVIRVRTAPLAVVDTVATFASRVRVIHAGYVNGDGETDFLIGLDTVVVRIIAGPAGGTDTIPIQLTVETPFCGGPPDTVFVTGTVRDIEIDDAEHRFWVGYYATVRFWPCFDAEAYETAGGMCRFDSTNAEGTTIIEGRNVLDISVCRAPGAWNRSLIAFWHYSYTVEIHFQMHEPRIAQTGYIVYNDRGEMAFSATLLDVFARGGDGFARAGFFSPVRLADMTGDGTPEFLYTYGSEWGDIDSDTVDVGLRAYTLGADTALWTWTSIPYIPASVWEVDGDGLPDVLLHPGYYTPGLPGGYPATALKGSTGDSLLTVVTPINMHPEVIGSLENGGDQRGVLVRSDTLVVFHFDFTTGVSDDPAIRPRLFELHQNYPNPFNASTTLRYSVANPAPVTLVVHNVLGQRVRTLVNRIVEAGGHEVQWNGHNDAGHVVGSGVYFAVMKVDQVRQVRKMLLIK